MTMLEKIQRLRKRASFITSECTRLETTMQECLRHSAALVREAEALGADLLTKHAARAAEIKTEMEATDAKFKRAFAELERLKHKSRGFLNYGHRILGE